VKSVLQVTDSGAPSNGQTCVLYLTFPSSHLPYWHCHINVLQLTSIQLDLSTWTCHQKLHIN